MFQQRCSLGFMLRAEFRVALAGLALAAALGCAASARAAESSGDVFTVKDVAVDATAATAAAAREQAIAEGERTAFQRLLARLTLRQDEAHRPKPSNTALTDLVEGFEVQQEKNSPVRYIATLTYHFKPHAIEQLLRDNGVAFAETVSKPVLVLPVLRSGNTLALWDDPNPWRMAWAGLPPADGLVPFIVPLGDINDMADIKADEAAQGDQEKLRKIGARYGAGSELVAVATPGGSQDKGGDSLSISVTRYGDGLQPQTVVTTVSGQSGETMDTLLPRAALQVEADTTERWKADNLLHFDQTQEATISVPITGLEDWVKVRQRLDKVALISRLQLVYLSRSEARIDVNYIGDPAQLKLALAQRDLMLTDEGGGMVLHLSAPGASAGTSQP